MLSIMALCVVLLSVVTPEKYSFKENEKKSFKTFAARIAMFSTAASNKMSLAKMPFIDKHNIIIPFYFHIYNFVSSEICKKKCL
jgi:hypothetical protein